MLHRSAILSTAWGLYRVLADIGRYRSFQRDVFAGCLRDAWAEAHRTAQPVKANPAQVRVDEIRAELQVMDFSDTRTDWNRRQALTGELAALTSMGA